jgi:hypothetical protein
MANPMPMAPAPTARVTKLCPHCLTENEEFSHMCRACLTPMTFFAATVPVFSVWAECNTYYKASQAPSKFIVVLGMWLICGPWCLVCAGLALMTVGEALAPSYRGGNPAALLVIIPLAALVCVPAILLVRTTRRYYGGRGDAGPGTRWETVADEGEELTRAALDAAPEGTEPGDVEGGEKSGGELGNGK